MYWMVMIHTLFFAVLALLASCLYNLR